MLEKNFEKKIREELKKIPNSFWEDKTPSSSVRGIPDVRGCINGRYVALELKRNTQELMKRTKTTELQKYNLRQIHKAGGWVSRVIPATWPQIYKKLWRLSGE